MENMERAVNLTNKTCLFALNALLNTIDNNLPHKSRFILALEIESIITLSEGNLGKWINSNKQFDRYIQHLSQWNGNAYGEPFATGALMGDV